MKFIDYQEEIKHNEEAFRSMAKTLHPNLFSLVEALNLTCVNPWILTKIVYQLDGISKGTHWGEISLLVNDSRCVRVSGVQTEKMDDAIILEGDKR